GVDVPADTRPPCPGSMTTRIRYRPGKLCAGTVAAFATDEPIVLAHELGPRGHDRARSCMPRALVLERGHPGRQYRCRQGRVLLFRCRHVYEWPDLSGSRVP